MAGIIATVIMFAILFTVGGSYFIFVQAQNASYSQDLLSASNKVQGSLQEHLSVGTVLETNGDVGFYANNTSSVTVNMTAALVISSAGALLKCDGVGFPSGAGCSNSTPTLWRVVTPNGESPTIDTGYLYVSGTTVTVKVLTARGNTYSAAYPTTVTQSSSSQSVAVSLDNLKWVQLVPQASSLAQKKYVSNCNAASCAASFTSSVTAGNILVDAVGWANQAPPSSVPTDTRSDLFTLGASSSVVVPSTPAIVQDKYSSNCNAASCGLAFSSSVTSENTLVYAVGWANNSPPSAPTDTRGDSFTLGSSQSVTVVPPTPALVQHRYNSNCNSATCALAFSSAVTAGDTLALGLGWPSALAPPYVPVTVTNCQVPNVPALDGSRYTSSANPGTTITAALTTTTSNDVIIAIAYGQNSATNSFRTPSVSDTSGLSWTARSSLEENGNTGDNGYSSAYSQIFYAIASSTLSSDSIKVTWNSAPTAGAVIQVFGISGANTSSPFDPNSGLPAWASPGAWASASTSNANDFIYGFENTVSTQTPTTGSGWSPITSGVTNSYLAAEYQVVSSTQSSLNVSFSNAASDTNVDWGDAIQAASGCAASSAPILDGSTGAGTETSSTSASLTTANSNDLIVVFTGTSSSTASVSSISDTGGHTWTHRQTETGSPSVEEEEWYTTASSPLSSDSITVTWSAAGDNVFTAFGVSGVNNAAPFDANSSLAAVATGTNTSPTVSVTTSNANDLIIGMLANEHTSFAACHTETYGNGFSEFLAESALGSNTCMNSDEEYQVVSSTQSGLAIPFSTSTGGSNQWAEIGDAIQAAPATATPNPFQQMVTWDPATYSSYEATNLGNVRFCSDSLCGTPLYAWLESCSSTCSSSGSSSTSATAWVKLTSSIASGSSLTIYMVFEATSVNFDGNYWGEAPQLSGTYAQYDNGANVFSFYDDFAGSSLSSKWQTVIYGGGSISVNNGLTISATSNTYDPILASKNTYSPGVLDADMALSSKQTAQSTPTIFYATVLPGTSGGDYGFKTAYRYDWVPYSNLFRNIADVSGSYAAGTTAGYTLPTSYNIWSGTWGATGSEAFAFNYVTQYTWTDTHITYGSAYVGTAGAEGGTVNEYWIRLRALPPNNIMPTASLGTFTAGSSGGAIPTVTDTLGDPFTLAVSQSATTSSNTYESAIWYATASSTGSDTITATFAVTAAGSISIYELTGYSTSGVSYSTGLSTTGSTAASVGSFTPSSNSFVIGNVETGSTSTKYTVGGGYTTVASGAGGCDASDASEGCGEYESGVGSATTTPLTLSASTPWAEVAGSFAPAATNTYYSYVWYATAGSTGADTVSASFGSTVAGSVSIYELSGVTATGLLSSTGSSTSSQTSGAVSSITPTTGSVVIGNVETASTTYTAGTSYTLSGSCSGVAGCGEYQMGVGSASTVPISMSPATPWVEAALAFAPTTTTYYSYIWYATAASSGADTVTTTFGATVAASVSIYELNGYTTSGALSSTGSSSTASTSASVTSFTPASDSFTVGAAEGASGSTTYTATSGFTLVGTCNSVGGCSEYNAGGGGSASTVPMTLGASTPWVEAALSFSTPFNPQSGIQVGGYPTMGVSSGATVVWEVTFTNVDPLHRAITVWPQSLLAIGSAEWDGFDTDYTQAHFYIIDSLNAGSTTVNAYTKTTGHFLSLPYGVPTTLYFASTLPLGATTQSFGTNVLTPFEAYFALTGEYSDTSLFGETIPYPYGIITQANAYTTPTTGANSSTVTVSCTSPCHFNANSKAMVGWINSAGQLTQLTTFTTSGSGNIPSGVTFAVPKAASGYYTIEVTDYTNSVFMTFTHT